METSHALLFIHGLGNDKRIYAKILDGWRKYNFEPILYDVDWHDKEHSFVPKLKRLNSFIDRLSSKYKKNSIMGASAGASAAVFRGQIIKFLNF